MAAPKAHVGMLIAAFILCGTAVRAHHSFGAEYDATRPVTVTGVVTRIEWTNPHCHHTEALHVVERYTRVDKDQINWKATVEDRDVLTKPWVLKTTMMLREGTRIEENICENNVDVDRYEHLLKEGIDFTRH